MLESHTFVRVKPGASELAGQIVEVLSRWDAPGYYHIAVPGEEPPRARIAHEPELEQLSSEEQLLAQEQVLEAAGWTYRCPGTWIDPVLGVPFGSFTAFQVLRQRQGRKAIK